MLLYETASRGSCGAQTVDLGSGRCELIVQCSSAATLPFELAGQIAHLPLEPAAIRAQPLRTHEFLRAASTVRTRSLGIVRPLPRTPRSTDDLGRFSGLVHGNNRTSRNPVPLPCA